LKKNRLAYAVVEVPVEIKTVKEADDWVWEQMKRAVDLRDVILLPSVKVYQLDI